MSPRDKRTSFTESGRRYQVAYSWHHDPEVAARYLGEAIRNQASWPEGFHFWTGRVQKDPRGRRASLQVVYQEDRTRESASNPQDPVKP